MSNDREELRLLFRGLSDEQLSMALVLVLAEVPRRSPQQSEPSWPPSWFGMAEGDGTAYGARAKELLGHSFGQSRL